MKPISIGWLLLAIALSSCEKYVDIRVREADRKIVLSGLLCTDSTLIVHVSRSSQLSRQDLGDITKPYVDPWMADEVSLYEDDRLVGQLVGKQGNFLEIPGFKPSVGKTYRLRASQGEMKPVSATVRIPEPAHLTAFDTIMAISENGRAAFRMSLQISDPAVQENFYALQVTGIQRPYYDIFERIWVDSTMTYNCTPRLSGKTDGMLELDFLDANRDVYVDRRLFFSDRLFDGKLFDMKFEVLHDSWGKMADTVLFRVDLYQVDKSYYQYAVSRQKYHHTQNNPFVEPVQVYSNVENGFGLVSAYAVIRKEFWVDWRRLVP
jgi:hypothetical protein